MNKTDIKEIITDYRPKYDIDIMKGNVEKIMNVVKFYIDVDDYYTKRIEDDLLDVVEELQVEYIDKTKNDLEDEVDDYEDY